MKYFSLSRLRGDDDDLYKPHRAYRAYIESIRSQLTGNLSDFIDTISLHDAQIINFSLDVSDKRLEFLLDAVFPSQGLVDVEHHRLRLAYEGVSRFCSTATPREALLGPDGYGDLLHDEIELLDDQTVEHRFLFSSSIELQIRFQEIQWQRLDAS